MSGTYRNDRFNFSKMTERLTFQTQNADGSFTDEITVWANIIKDGFVRSNTDTYYKVMIRGQRALESLLEVGNRLMWNKRTLFIHSWQYPSYEDKGFIEIIVKQIATNHNDISLPTDGDFMKDFVSVYRLIQVPVTKYGLTSYEFTYDFTTPSFTGVRCYFDTDRNMFINDKKFDTEHDTVIVKFNGKAPIEVDDYIISPVHGKFKVDMVVLNDDNMLEARVQRGEVQ